MSTPKHPSYAQAYEIEFPTYNGLLTEQQRAEWRERWLAYIETSLPETRQIWKERGGQGVAAWASAGGLQVRSGGATKNFWSALRAEYMSEAKEAARRERQAAGWLDDGTYTFRIAPSGAVTKDGSSTWPKLTRPGQEQDTVWDGVNHDGVHFAT